MCDQPRASAGYDMCYTLFFFFFFSEILQGNNNLEAFVLDWVKSTEQKEHTIL